MESQETQQQEQTNSMFDGIEEALDVETSIVKNENGCVKRSDEAQEAVNGILDVAQQSDQPRAYEVAGQLIKHVGDVADKLADLHKKVNDIENPKQSRNTEVTNNTMFVGSTAELAKFLKSKRDK